MEQQRHIRVLVNLQAGGGWSFLRIQDVIRQEVEKHGHRVTYQFSHDPEDGARKAEEAVHAGVDSIWVVGGDGMINTIGARMVGTGVGLGVIPVGSGNGFARHFAIPLRPERAVRSLAASDRTPIDVGMANGRPFFVTCSLAWDAAIVRTFERLPVRGFLPYLVAGAYELFEYQPQDMQVELDGVIHAFELPMVCTAANLTQYGSGVQIAPQADANDGRLELVVICRRDIPAVLANVNRFFDRRLYRVPGVQHFSFQHMRVRRQRPEVIQLDGEKVEAPATVDVHVASKRLTVLIPPKTQRDPFPEDAVQAQNTPVSS